MTNLRLGINLWSQAATWPEMLAFVRRVDSLGYDSVWTWDHLYAIVGDPHQPIFEGWGMLNAWAMATEHVRLGLLVGANTFRNPGLVAKQAATLDHVSGGRAILGIGGAWMEPEHTAHGIPFGAGFGERLDWLDESVAAIRSLLDGGTVTSPAGGHYDFRELRHAPPPVQSHLPILIGGNGRTKTLKTIAKYADMWNGFGTPDEVRELEACSARTAPTSDGTSARWSGRSTCGSRSATRRRSPGRPGPPGWSTTEPRSRRSWSHPGRSSARQR